MADVISSQAPLASGPRVDVRLLKFSQAWVVGLTALAFITQARWLVILAAAALALSAAAPAVGPFRLLYRYIAAPLKLLRPRVVEDDPAPHRFAQAVGAVFLIASSVFLFALPAVPSIGWTLDLIVFALATLNLTVGFCAGCFVYYQLGQIGMAPRVRYNGGFRWRGA